MDDGSLDRLFAGVGDRFDDQIAYVRRPVQWIEDKLREYPWSAQREIIESVRDHRYTAVHSAHELGKTKIAAWAVSHWIDSHPPGEAFVITTAPTAAQVAAVMWREITKTHTRGNLPGHINRAGYPQWFAWGELVGYGRKPADYEQSAFQGIHARYVLVVVDEAGGVARQLYDAIDSIVANENSRVLAIGNPDDASSHLATICEPGSGWHVIHLDALRSPNMTRERIIGPDTDTPRFPLTKALMEAESIPYSTEPIPPGIREMLVDPLWIEERIHRWAGVTVEMQAQHTEAEFADLVVRRTNASSLFVAKVRGVFPVLADANKVIPLGWIEMAMNRHDDWLDAGAQLDQVPNPTRRVVGVDVARFGEDETVLAPRYGDVIAALHRYQRADTTETTDYAASYLHEPQGAAVVDVIGIGAGVYDLLRRYQRLQGSDGEALVHPTTTLIPFNASGSSARTDKLGQFKFRNDRAAAWWNFRERLDPSRGSKIALPRDERLRDELAVVEYVHLAGGIIKIESKDEIKKRLGRSTDSADAVIQAFWIDGLVHNYDPVPYATTQSPHKVASGAIQYEGHERFEDADFSPFAHASVNMSGEGFGLNDDWT